MRGKAKEEERIQKGKMMPVPRPQGNENRDNFLKRCMGDEVMAAEYPDRDQRYAVCTRQWEEKVSATLRFILKEIEGVPAEFQVLPIGESKIEGEAPVLLDREGMKTIIAEFERRGNDMVIDYEHQTLRDGQAPAAGWVKNLIDKGAHGLWAAVEWTDRAREYLKNREYRYFSPVFWIGAKDRRVVKIEHMALTNYPKLNSLRPIVARLEMGEPQRKETSMLEKLKKLLGLADDAGEDQVMTAVEALVAKNKEMEVAAKNKPAIVASKAVLEAIGVKEGADLQVVIAAIDGLKAPATAAQELSRQVAKLTAEIAGMKRDDMVALALKEGKTSPAEVEAWGRDLAEKNPEQFQKIVLSRPVGSVVPVIGLPPKGKDREGQPDEAALLIAKQFGNTEEDLKKYGAIN